MVAAGKMLGGVTDFFQARRPDYITARTFSRISGRELVCLIGKAESKQTDMGTENGRGMWYI